MQKSTSTPLDDFRAGSPWFTPFRDLSLFRGGAYVKGTRPACIMYEYCTVGYSTARIASPSRPVLRLPRVIACGGSSIFVSWYRGLLFFCRVHIRYSYCRKMSLLCLQYMFNSISQRNNEGFARSSRSSTCTMALAPLGVGSWV